MTFVFFCAVIALILYSCQSFHINSRWLHNGVSGSARMFDSSKINSRISHYWKLLAGKPSLRGKANKRNEITTDSIPAPARISNLLELDDEATDDEADVHEEGILSLNDVAMYPDTDGYSQYFTACTTPTNDKISYQQFMEYPKLQQELMKPKRITLEDIEETWITVVGNDQMTPLLTPLSLEDSLEVLAMLYGIVDIDQELAFREVFQELVETKENLKLLKPFGFTAPDLQLQSIVVSTAPVRKKHVQYGSVSKSIVLEWEALKEIIDDQVMTIEEIEDLWKIVKEANIYHPCNPNREKLMNETASKSTTTIRGKGKKGITISSDKEVMDVEEFLYFNRLLDEIIEAREGSNDSLEEEEYNEEEDLSKDIEKDGDDDQAASGSELESEGEDEFQDFMTIDWDSIWSPEFDFSPIYEPSMINELQQEYQLLTSTTTKAKKSISRSKQSSTTSKDQSLLSYEQFKDWKDIQEILTETLLTETEIRQLWEEALSHRQSFMKTPSNNNKKKKPTKSDMDSDQSINFPLFLRLNAKIEYLLALKEEEDEVENSDTASEPVGDKDDDEEEATATDPTSFYREQFELLTAQTGRTTLRFNDFLDWEEVKELVSEGVLSQKQLKQLFDTIPNSEGGGISVEGFIMLNNMIDVLIETKNTDEDNNRISDSSISSTTSKATVIPPSLQDQDRYYRRPSNDQELTPQFSTSTSSGSLEKTSHSFFLDDEDEDANSSQGRSQKRSAININMLDEIEQKLKQQSATLNNNNNNKVVEKGQLSDDDYKMLTILDQAETLLSSGSFGSFDQLIGDDNDDRLTSSKTLASERQALAAATANNPLLKMMQSGKVKDIVDRLLVLGESQQRCGMDIKKQFESQQQKTRKDTEDGSTAMSGTSTYEQVNRDFSALLQLLTEQTTASEFSQKLAIDQIRQLLNGKWELLFTNSEMFYFYNGLSGFVNILPGSQLQAMEVEFQSDGYLSETHITEKVMNTLLPNKPIFPITITGTYEIVKEISFMTNELSLLFRHYPKEVTVTKLKYAAEENWKSLRSIALNEITYVDEKCLILRNAGALRIFFIFKRKD